MFKFFKKSLKIRSSQDSYAGTRPYNEDSFQKLDTKKRHLYVLADGLGGMGNGKLASETAVEAAIRFGTDAVETGQEFMKELFEASQKAVLEKKTADTSRMATTMVALEIKDDTACWAHIGDSRLYWFRDGQIRHQTADQSVPQMLVRIGEITPDEIRNHPDRSRLLHTIGYEWEENPCEVSEELHIRKGDAFLLCSDGFWEYIGEPEMEELLRGNTTPETWLDAMMETVRKHGENKDMDNCSAMCIMVL